jgi:hypothetical protein
MFKFRIKPSIDVSNVDLYFILSKEHRTKKSKYFPFIHWYLHPRALPIDENNNWDTFYKRIRKEFPIQWFIREYIPDCLSDIQYKLILSPWYKVAEIFGDSNRELKKSISRKYQTPIEISESVAFYYFVRYVLKQIIECKEPKQKIKDPLGFFKTTEEYQKCIKEQYYHGSWLEDNANLGNLFPVDYWLHIQAKKFLEDLTEVFVWFKFEKIILKNKIDGLWKAVGEMDRRNMNDIMKVYSEIDELEESFDEKSLRVSNLVFKYHDMF